MLILVNGASKTVTRLSQHRAYKNYLGHLISPECGNSLKWISSTGLKWAADNGCYYGLNRKAFERMLFRINGSVSCLFVCCPDVVGDYVNTLRLWKCWSNKILSFGVKIAFVAQDGIETAKSKIPWSDMDAMFIGGSTNFKLSQEVKELCYLAKNKNKWVHMGRVNSVRRMRIALDFGCDSIDGTSTSKYPDTHLPRLLKWAETFSHKKKDS